LLVDRCRNFLVEIHNGMVLLLDYKVGLADGRFHLLDQNVKVLQLLVESRERGGLLSEFVFCLIIFGLQNTMLVSACYFYSPARNTIRKKAAPGPGIARRTRRTYEGAPGSKMLKRTKHPPGSHCI
jgi:hypothetical protein